MGDSLPEVHPWRIRPERYWRSLKSTPLTWLTHSARPASSGRDTHTPDEVVDIIDGTLCRLHQIRERAVGDSRRRLDAAMERTAALLDELRTRRGPVR